MRGSTIRTLALALAGVSLPAIAAPSVAQAQTQNAARRNFNIPAQDMAGALEAFGRQSGRDILFDRGQVAGRRSNAVWGSLEPGDALRRLVSGSGLSVSTPNAATFIVGRGSGEGQAGSAAADSESANREIVVTGSRLGGNATPTQNTYVYDRQRIERSGQSTVTGFLNTLSTVGISTNSTAIASASETVRLHGLPGGATLVMIDGRRMPGSGAFAFNNTFNLSRLPLAAVERIDVLPEGSSAIYGSDAIAGVVNIILRKDFEGGEINAEYGAASGTDTIRLSGAVGHRWDRGSVSLLATYKRTSNLLGAERSISREGDRRRYGAADQRFAMSFPGNIFSLSGNLPGLNSPYAAVPDGLTGTPTTQSYAGTAGTLNLYALPSGFSLIPQSRTLSGVASARFELSDNVEFAAQLFVSDVRSRREAGPAYLFGSTASQSYRVAAGNPFNPFGVNVGIAYHFPDRLQATDLHTTNIMPVAALRGDIGRWHWEVSGSYASERANSTFVNFVDTAKMQAAFNSTNPATALNPFIDGPAASEAVLDTIFFDNVRLYQDSRLTLGGFVRGPLAALPAGDVEVVLGSEYNRDKLASQNPSVPAGANPLSLASASVSRESSAVFGEARIPLLSTESPLGSVSVQLAGRYDDYEGFGGRFTPQAGLEWRPTRTLLLRAGWGRAFKAPSLYQVNFVPTTFTQTVSDPLRGGQSTGVTVTQGGNPALDPETGESLNAGFVFRPVDRLRLGATVWRIVQNNSIQSLAAQTVVNNESSFPGASPGRHPAPVVRPAPSRRCSPAFRTSGP